ncbi:DUF2330 domain-containing protein [Actinosynnema sp. NPDC050436]|uniref:DUF2330 domain-containing protein n=1 Tax=Actinosynnema sp. NPDC050436 TaxID=3155659 RepID=UPI0033D5DF5B
MAQGRTTARIAAVVAVAVALVTVNPAVSGACACGAFVANDKLRTQQETALVELDGRTESITVAVQARSQARQAAFLMPVPARARFEVADGGLFAELDRLTRPRVETRRVVVDGDGVGGSAPGRGATVVDRVEVGPYDVAQLGGTDESAVTQWLGDNDFTLPAALGGALRPYLADGWLVVAVRLSPASGSLAGGLPPMRLTFETDTPVYPMRLSGTAEHVQPLRLYVLADHRVDVGNPAPQDDAPELTFAGEVRADPEHPGLSALLTAPRYLTRYDAEFRPERITDDIRITRAATDEPYRAVVVVTEYVRSPWRSPVVLVAAGGVLLVGVALLLVWRRRRKATRESTEDGR